MENTGGLVAFSGVLEFSGFLLVLVMEIGEVRLGVLDFACGGGEFVDLVDDFGVEEGEGVAGEVVGPGGDDFGVEVFFCR